MSSATVVFSIPHLRRAIFGYHAAFLVEQRTDKLRSVKRSVRGCFWDAIPYPWDESQLYITPLEYFNYMRLGLTDGTNLVDLLRLLGLELATYLDFLDTRPEDRSLWLAACTTAGGSRKWHEAEIPFLARCVTRLDAHPKEEPGSPHSIYEKPQSNAMEMLYYCAGKDTYRMRQSDADVQHWSKAEGLAHLLRDRTGRVYVLQLLSTRRQPFIFQAADKHPELLYSNTSPFLPIYDAFTYRKKDHIGVVISQCPPFPLSSRLLPDEGQDELRRVLERARDLFAQLAALRQCGVSLDGQRPSSRWEDCFLTGKSGGPWLIPAYLEPSYQDPSRLTRLGHCIERLPMAPRDAWPLSPLKGRGGIAGLPWSQVTAYNDPRVPGPTVYLHGLREASLSDADSKQRLRTRRIQEGSTIFPFPDKVADRFHLDLLVITDHILRRLYPLYEAQAAITVKLLESSHTSVAYTKQVEQGPPNGPRDPALGHSGLFTLCANCALGCAEARFSRGGPGACPTCDKQAMVSALPDQVRQLFLQIVRPEARADGSLHIVTAKEALAVMESTIATELPRLERVYNLFVERQAKVARITSNPALSLDVIRRDPSHHRLILFELLRGNFLDKRFRRPEYVELKDEVKRHLIRKKQQEGKGRPMAAGAGTPFANSLTASSMGGCSSAVMSSSSVDRNKEVVALSDAAPEAAKRSAEGEGGRMMVKRIRGG